MVLVTTIVTPPLLTARLKRTSNTSTTRDEDAGEEPTGGWISIESGRLSFRDTPPSELVVPLALRVSELSTFTSISPSVFDWFASKRNSIGPWSPSNTEALVDLLRDGSPVAWRTLTNLGVLETALPEIGQTLDRRRASAEVMGRSHSIVLPLVDRINHLTSSPGRDREFDALHQRLARPELLLLAAFVSNSTDDGPMAISLARRLSPESGDDIVRSLGLAEALVDAVRGPDMRVDDALASVSDSNVVVVGMIIALFTTDGSGNSALRTATTRGV
jgi:hypothetical protein